MEFTVECPLERHGHSAEFADPGSLIRFARAAEAAGFGAIDDLDTALDALRRYGEDVVAPMSGLS